LLGSSEILYFLTFPFDWSSLLLLLLSSYYHTLACLCEVWQKWLRGEREREREQKREREKGKMREIKHLSVHQWLRSAIPDSQQPTSPIGFLFLKLPPPPCAYYWYVKFPRSYCSIPRIAARMYPGVSWADHIRSWQHAEIVQQDLKIHWFLGFDRG